MSNRNPPELANREVEARLLGRILLGHTDDLQAATVRALAPGDFFDRNHRDIWSAVLAVAEKGLDPTLEIVQDELGKRNQLQRIGGLPRLVQLTNVADAFTGGESYAAVILDYSRRRQAIAHTERLAKGIYATDTPLAESLAESLTSLGNLDQACNGSEAELFSLVDLLDDKTATPPDIVAGFIPGLSAVLFSGPGGDGKSYAMLDMAVCVARGTPWLGLNVTQTPVLYIDLENRKLRQRDRVRRVLLGHNLLDEPPPVILAFELEHRLDTDRGVAEIARMAERCGAGLVILDSLTDFLGELDENSNSEMAQVAERLRLISELTGGSVEAIHHTPKNNASTPRGATALRNNLDVNVMAARDGSVLSMRQDKNRTGPEMTVRARLNWAPGLFNLSPLGTSQGRPQRSGDPDEAAILEHLNDGQWHDSSEVRTAVMAVTKHSRSGVNSKIRGLVEDLIIEQEESGPGRASRLRYLENEARD